MGIVKDFIKHNFRHFNAASVIDAAQGWVDYIAAGNKMMLTMGGAASTAELGITIAELIRQDKIHAISMTGANLEEDLFNLVAHNHYKRIPHYRYLNQQDEQKLYDEGFNRVTDTCIPEDEAIRKIEGVMLDLWNNATRQGKRYFPYEMFYEIVLNKTLQSEYQIDPKDSWLIAAAEKNLPIFTFGWADSTIGNIYAASVVSGKIVGGNIFPLAVVKSDIEQMIALKDWYLDNQKDNSIGFFQLGGGISGDAPICVVPMIRQDLHIDCKLWGYFAQISDSTESYGSYSGAKPSEKITWGKLAVDSPMYVINSDYTIVFPLIAAYLLDM